MTSVKPLPDDYPRVCPYLAVAGAAEAIEFYAGVFGAEERLRIPGPAGTIGHAEIRIGDGVVMLSDEYPEMDVHGPKSLGGTPVTVAVYVEDVDQVFSRAVAAGAKSIRPVEDQFYGDRAGQFEDPFGHRWNVATRVENVPSEELHRRAAKFMGGEG